jgi:endoglucanase
VSVGDPATFAVGLERLQGDLVASRAFDDKMGAFIVTRVLKEVRRRGPLAVDLHGVSTVQEEVGLRGATTSAYGVDPDIGIAIDVGFATDFPGVEKKEVGEFKVGQGPIISRGANVNPALFELLVSTARQEQIPFQIMGAPRGTGTDANVMQLSRGGVATALLQVPLRYMHSPVEVLSLADLEHTIRLLAALMPRLGEAGSFIPN